ncbi:hypothetical protein chiPu_0016208 [Chiloscyllium punctatum]|uniref:Tetratricopeptide repeat protein 38 n=1 Tax=Chiloscyllium punctatum TaxID=137246 RepID=A0A401T4Z8_CHIPU|nr:hypothetical protein [Chiloscyllium punctatum]
MVHSNLRDCKAWQDIGLPLSTTSNEACKMYDAFLSQWVSWTNDPSLGGIEGCKTRLQAADPDFVMGHVLINGIELTGTGNSIRLDKDLDTAVKKMVGLAKTQGITERERLHVEALDLFSKGYLKGMYSFGLVETNFYDLAEKTAKEGLVLNPCDAWSAHSLAHVYEMRADVNNGLKFMKETENNWKGSDMLACHNYWHWALYHIEKGDYDSALSVYDARVSKSCFETASMLDIIDTSSMLYRLQMEGVNVDNQWKKLARVTKDHAKDQILIFNDAHILMSLFGAKEINTANEVITSLQELSKTPGENYQYQIGKDLGLPICQAIAEFANGNYSRTVDLLNPVRYQIQNIGGSNAQRDVFNLLLIHAALKSDSRDHQKLARCLVLERDAFRPNSPMTERLIRKATALHNVD